MNYYLGVFVPGTRDVVHLTADPDPEVLGTSLALWCPGDATGQASWDFAEAWPLECWGSEEVEMVEALYRARGLQPPPLPPPRR